VFYDGGCGFCNRSVQFVLKNNKCETVYFSAIQSDFTQSLFKQNEWGTPDLSTFYFLDEGKLYSKSSGALRLAKYFKYPQKLLRLFIVIPRFVRDAGYDFIARRRQRLSKGYCVIPNEKERQRFIP